MKELFTAAALAVTALSLIGTAQAFAGATKHVRHVAHARSNQKALNAHALIPNNYFAAPSSSAPATTRLPSPARSEPSSWHAGPMTEAARLAH